MPPFRPMLAADIKGRFDELRFPLLATPKIDGIRACTPEDWEPLSRHLKPIPNRHIKSLFHEHALALKGLDGELIAKDLDKRATFQETSSAVMSHAGEPLFTFCVFDVIPHVHCTKFIYDPITTWPYEDRMKYLEEWRQKNIEFWPDWAELLLPVPVNDLEELRKFEENVVEVLGYEGICLRNPKGRYKHGRSTLREGWLLKCKRFCDSEGVIIDTKPLERNVSCGFKNELGYKTHHYRQENMVADNCLGAVIVEDETNFPGEGGISVGSGFGQEERYELWRDRAKLIGKTIKYKYFPHGVKRLPRHPIFLGFRED